MNWGQTLHPPDAVVVPHHIDALRVRQVAALYEQVEDAPAAEFKLLSDDALQIRHHTTRVQVHKQPAHATVDQRRRRIVKLQTHADKVVTGSSHRHQRDLQTSCQKQYYFRWTF